MKTSFILSLIWIKYHAYLELNIYLYLNYFIIEQAKQSKDTDLAKDKVESTKADDKKK